MPNTGYALPSVGESLDRFGGVAWTNPTGIVDFSGADVTFGEGSVSDWLVARDFNFSIDGATVVGVQVLIAGSFTVGNVILGTVVGSVVTSLGVGKVYSGGVLGGATDLWDTSFSVADVVADTFAVLIVEAGDEFGGTANVTSVQAMIYYGDAVEPVPFVGHLDGHNVTPMVWKR